MTNGYWSPRLTDDAADRLRNLRDVGALLWNGTSRVGRRQRGGDLHLMVVPRASRPRLAVPADHPRAAAAAVLVHGESDTRAARRQRRLLAWLLRSGAGPSVFRTGLQLTEDLGSGVLDHLEKVVGQRTLVSIALTPRRANRKPVVHLLDPRGRTVAFAKIGTTPLTRELVRHETAVLRQLASASLTTLRPPEVLYAGPWGELELLVLSPLPTWQAPPPTPSLLASAMRELAELRAPDDNERPSVDYPSSLIARAKDAGRNMSTEDLTVLTELLDYIEQLDSHPASPGIRLGRWHGDWTQWNCRQHHRQVLLWDWERCRPDVPLGFDALHYAVQTAAVRDRVSRRRAALQCVDDAPTLLRPWRVADEQAPIVAGFYLAEIGVRYLADAQRGVGGPGGDVSAWVLPALRSLLKERGFGTNES